MGGCGTNYTAALFAGGYSGTYQAVNESWNGTSWTEVADLNAAIAGVAGAGTNTSALSFAGFNPSNPNGSVTNESWNGSSWTEVGDLNNQRYLAGGTGASHGGATGGDGGDGGDINDIPQTGSPGIREDDRAYRNTPGTPGGHGSDGRAIYFSSTTVQNNTTLTGNSIAGRRGGSVVHGQEGPNSFIN